MQKRTKQKKSKKQAVVPDQAWSERLNRNVRESEELQELLWAHKAAGGFSEDIFNFLYGYCAWDSLFTSRMAKWREHLLEQYAKAEKNLLKAASDLEKVNRDTYMTRLPWGQLIQDAHIALLQELNHPPLVASEVGHHTVGMTPVNLTVELPRMLRLFADHLKQLGSAASMVMFARQYGPNCELVELYLYLCCIKGIEPRHIEDPPFGLQGVRKIRYKAVCDEVALLIGAAVDKSIEPELVEKNVENFMEMNPWLYKLADERFSKYAQYRTRALAEHNPVAPYHKWREDNPAIWQ